MIVLSLINYFKLSFRDDPLLVEDLSLFFEMRNMTERYKIHISSSKKVNIIAIMMEAYGDFSVYPQIEFDSENNPYAAFNRIKEISYHGNLLTDIFAAGTVRTERRFITGADAYPSLRKNTYSYARYFTDQGYCVEGSHPCYSWFYNRINVNDHLGFSKYDFYESRYSELANGEIAGDNVLFPELYKDLKNSIDDGIPYFNLSVTYQNHGPYSTEQLYDTSYVIKQEDYTDDEYNILNNYLSGIKNTGEELEKLIEEIESLDEPCVLVAFGDHKPWLGEGNSVYEMLGIDLDVSTLEGFYNYYATPYINSRKLNVKAIVEFLAVVDEEKQISIPVELKGEEEISAKKKTIRVLTLAVHKKDTLRKKEEITIASNKPNIHQILWKDIQVRNVPTPTVF